MLNTELGNMMVAESVAQKVVANIQTEIEILTTLGFPIGIVSLQRSFQYNDSHYKDKTVVRPSYFCNGIPEPERRSSYLVIALNPSTTQNHLREL